MLEIPFVICSQWVRLCCGSSFGAVSSRFRRMSCGGVVLTSLALDEFSEWSAMVSKLRRGVLRSGERSELKEFWHMQSRLMGEGSGRGNSVRNRMCGRGSGGATHQKKDTNPKWQGCALQIIPTSAPGIANQCFQRSVPVKIN